MWFLIFFNAFYLNFVIYSAPPFRSVFNEFSQITPILLNLVFYGCINAIVRECMSSCGPFTFYASLARFSYLVRRVPRVSRVYAQFRQKSPLLIKFCARRAFWMDCWCLWKKKLKTHVRWCPLFHKTQHIRFLIR